MTTQKQRSAAAAILGALGGAVVTPRRLEGLKKARAAKAEKKEARDGKK
jgi:hypothetical protein